MRTADAERLNPDAATYPVLFHLSPIPDGYRVSDCGFDELGHGDERPSVESDDNPLENEKIK